MREPRVTTLLVTSLSILAMVGPVATDMYTPGFPGMADDLATDPGSIQLTLALFMAGMAVGQLFWGPLSDTVGRRGPLAIAASGFVVSSALVACVPDVRLLIALRFIQGFAGTAGVVIGRAIARDLTDGAALARLLSIIGVVMGISPIAAPVLGGLLIDSIGWRGVMWVVTGIAVLMALIAYFVIPESLRPELRVAGGPRSFLETLGSVVRDVPFLGYTAIGMFTFGTAFAYISGSSAVLQEVYGLTPLQFSLCFAVNAAGMTAMGVLNARLVGRFGPDRMLLVGLAIMVGGAVLLAALALAAAHPPLWSVLVLVLVTTSVMPLIVANSSSLGLSRHAKGAGMAAAFMGALQYGMAGLVSPMVTVTGQASVQSVIAVMTVCSLLAAAARLLARGASVP